VRGARALALVALGAAAMKTRFTAADCAAQVACLRATCLGHRCANVYDLNARTYLFKLSQSGADAAAQAHGGAGADDAAGGGAGADSDAGAVKTLLLMESGTRFHTTQYMRDKARAAPRRGCGSERGGALAR
jgi:hypothetical protein